MGFNPDIEYPFNDTDSKKNSQLEKSVKHPVNTLTIYPNWNIFPTGIFPTGMGHTFRVINFKPFQGSYAFCGFSSNYVVD